MRKIAVLLIFVFVSLVFLPPAYGQIPLQPGNFTFTILSIWVFPPKYSPYGGNYRYPNTTMTIEHPLGLEGHFPNYLNIRWNASYSDGSIREIRVNCYLNTPNKNCTTTYIPGEEGQCSILFPSYGYSSLNTVICNFSDPANPNLFGTVNRSIQPVAFDVSALLSSATVGQEFTWEVGVVNRGALATNFSVNISSSLPGVVWVNPSVANTSSVYWGEIAKFFPRMNFLLATDLTLYVLVRPTADDQIICPCPEIPYGTNPVCIDNKCWYKLEIPIKVGMASLPEFDAIGLLQIIFLAAIVLFLACKKSKY